MLHPSSGSPLPDAQATRPALRGRGRAPFPHRLPLYVLREVGPWYLGGVLLFLSLMMTDIISSTVGLLISYRVGAGQALSLLATQLPGLLNRCLVLSVPFAVLLAFGRLGKDSEFKAAAAAGVRPASLLWPLLVPALLVGLFAYYNAGWLAPAGNARWWDAWYGVYGQRPPPPTTDRYAYAQGDTLFTAGRVQNASGDGSADSATLQGVLIQQGTTTYTAALGRWDAAKQTWTVSGGYRVGPAGTPQPFTGPLVFAQRDRLSRPATPPDQTSTPALRARVEGAPGDGPNGSAIAGASGGGANALQVQRADRFELSRRVADPFTPLCFALASGALGLLIRNRAWGAAAVIVFIFAFYVLWSTVPQLAQAGAISPLLAAWMPNLAFLCFGGALLWRLR